MNEENKNAIITIAFGAYNLILLLIFSNDKMLTHFCLWAFILQFLQVFETISIIRTKRKNFKYSKLCLEIELKKIWFIMSDSMKCVRQLCTWIEINTSPWNPLKSFHFSRFNDYFFFVFIFKHYIIWVCAALGFSNWYVDDELFDCTYRFYWW